MSALASQITVSSASRGQLLCMPDDRQPRDIRLRQDRRRRYTAMVEKTYGDSKEGEHLLLKTLCLAQFMDASDARMTDLTAN